jgi:hypothetical protein
MKAMTISTSVLHNSWISSHTSSSLELAHKIPAAPATVPTGYLPDTNLTYLYYQWSGPDSGSNESSSRAHQIVLYIIHISLTQIANFEKITINSKFVLSNKTFLYYTDRSEKFQGSVKFSLKFNTIQNESLYSFAFECLHIHMVMFFYANSITVHFFLLYSALKRELTLTTLTCWSN